MTTRYFAGSSLAAFRRTAPGVVEDTTSGRFDSGFVSYSIFVPGPEEYIQTPDFGPATGTVWVRWDWYVTSNGVNNARPIILVNNGATGVFRLNNNQPQYWNGSAWTNTGTTITFSSATRYTFALKLNLNSGFELYLNGSLVSSGSSWSGGGTQCTHVRLRSHTDSFGAYISQVMIADYDIRDAKFATPAINGNSATNTGAASGVYTDINETVLDDSTAIAISTSGNKAGLTKASLSLAGGYQISAMVINARGRVSGGVITDGKLGIRSGSSNYSGSGRSYNGGYEPRTYIAETDPATSAAWGLSAFNSAEIYLEAA